MRFNFLISVIMLLVAPCLVAGVVTTHKGEVAGGYNFLFHNPGTIAALSSDSDSLSVDTVAQVVPGSHPLIIFLHGASLCGNDLNRVRRYGTIDAVEKGRNLDAYVLAPQNPGGAWKPEKIMRLVEWAKTSHNIDTTRIYVLGMSLGGYGTLDFTATYPGVVAAAAAYCGGATVRGDRLTDLNKVPLWIVHGTADRAISVKESDKVVNAMKSADSIASRLSYDRVAGMNHSQPARLFYLPDTYEWLMSHSLADSARVMNATPELTDSKLRTAYRDLKFKGAKRYKKAVKKSKSKSKSGKKKKKGRKKRRRSRK